MIGNLEHKELSIICKIRQAEIKRAEKEVLKYLEKFNLSSDDIKNI
jgi:hypothetical protein